jgi:hypothetical protein
MLVARIATLSVTETIPVPCRFEAQLNKNASPPREQAASAAQ